jgi:hypothetical protein
MIMLAFFAAFLQKAVNFPSLKWFVSAIIADEETIRADSQKANIGCVKKLTIALIP